MRPSNHENEWDMETNTGAMIAQNPMRFLKLRWSLMVKIVTPKTMKTVRPISASPGSVYLEDPIPVDCTAIGDPSLRRKSGRPG